MLAIFFVFAVVLYFFLAVIITSQVVRSRKTARGKRTAFLLCLLIFILIPTWDIPLLDWRFNQLCKTEAGIHIYEKAILGKEYWNEDGTLKFPLDKTLQEAMPQGFEIVYADIDRNLEQTGISKSRIQIKRKHDQKILGDRIGITRLGNWPLRIVGFASWLPIEDYSNVCPHPEKVPISDLVKNVFKQMNH